MPSINTVFLLTCILNYASLAIAASELPTTAGDLEIYLKSIEYGEKEDSLWQRPTHEQLNQFSYMFDSFLIGDYENTHQLAATIGYEVIKFINEAEDSPNNIYYILRETVALHSGDALGGGTYVLYPQGAAVALQAPHPESDLYTGQQAIETFLSVHPRLLALAGTRRDSSTEPSPCTGDYHHSDVVHGVDNFFFIAHERLLVDDPDTVFVQFHGFGGKSLKKLQQQCGVDTSVMVNLSEGVKNHTTDLNDRSFASLLANTLNDENMIAACLYGNDTRSLGGTWNTTGRLSNGSEDACYNDAPMSSRQFIHLEQSYKVRSAYRDLMADYLAEVIDEYFSNKDFDASR